MNWVNRQPLAVALVGDNDFGNTCRVFLETVCRERKDRVFTSADLRVLFHRSLIAMYLIGQDHDLSDLHQEDRLRAVYDYVKEAKVYVGDDVLREYERISATDTANAWYWFTLDRENVYCL